MRINKFVAASTGMSRRGADAAVESGKVLVNGVAATAGMDVSPDDTVTLDGKRLQPLTHRTVVLHKPVGYVTSRAGQGNQTIYDLLPPSLHHLKPVGRLDKDSSGVLVLTNDGDLADRLTHPRFGKLKQYVVTLDRPLQPLHRQMISDFGIQLEDGPSKLTLERATEGQDTVWNITMREGRNRQIRRTFAALGYKVIKLHRTRFGDYALDGLRSGDWRSLTGAS